MSKYNFGVFINYRSKLKYISSLVVNVLHLRGRTRLELVFDLQ